MRDICTVPGWKKVLFLVLEPVGDASRKVRRLQFPSAEQTNVFSAPLNSSFSRAPCNSTFHDPSVLVRRNVSWPLKAAFSPFTGGKRELYRISVERKVGSVLWAQLTNGMPFGEKTFIQSSEKFRGVFRGDLLWKWNSLLTKFEKTERHNRSRVEILQLLASEMFVGFLHLVTKEMWNFQFAYFWLHIIPMCSNRLINRQILIFRENLFNFA